MGYYDELDREVDRDLGVEPEVERPHVPSRMSRMWKRLSRFVMDCGRVGAKIVFFPVIGSIRFSPRFDADGNPKETRSFVQRIAEGLATRLMLTPVVLGLFFIAIVWLTTHPTQVQARQTPHAIGLTYQTVHLQSNDGQAIQGWYIAPLTADDVLLQGEAVLTEKRPAVVLVHGLGATHDEYLPLARQLHNAGFAVLMLSLRGQGESGAGAVTFGLRERFDVLAGVNYLRDLPLVDGEKITLVGSGIGAAAVLHAAVLDRSIRAVVVDGLWPSFSAWTRQIFAQPTVPTQWLAPLYEVTFELAMRERTGELDATALVRRLHKQNVLFIVRNAPDQPPVADSLALAAATTVPHDVIVLGGGMGVGGAGHVAGTQADDGIVKFLATSMGWDGPHANVPESVRELLKAKVK